MCSGDSALLHPSRVLTAGHVGSVGCCHVGHVVVLSDVVLSVSPPAACPLTVCPCAVHSGDPVLLQPAGLSHHRLHVPVNGGLLFLGDGAGWPAGPHAARLPRAPLQVNTGDRQVQSLLKVS